METAQHMSKEAVTLASTFSSHINLTISLRFWGSQGFLCNYSWSWHPTLSHFKLSSHSQQQSSSLICPLNSVFQHPDPACTRGCVPGWITWAVAWIVCVGLYPAYHKPIFALSPEPLNFLFLTQLIVLPMMGLPRVQKLLLSRFLPRAEVSSHFLFISFHLIQLYGDFSCPFRCLRTSASVQ